MTPRRINMNNKLNSFLEPADFKLEGILTSDNKKIGSYFINYINGSIYQFYNNSNDTITNYEHILILFLTEEDDFLKEIREIKTIKMIENGRNFDGENITKTTELNRMKLAYYCDVHDRRKIKETMLVFSSYNMKASNVKKEVNELLSRRQQENSLGDYKENVESIIKSLSENVKSIGESYRSISNRIENKGDDYDPTIYQASYRFNGIFTVAVGTGKFLTEYENNLKKCGKVELREFHSIDDK
jgi:hypothetical protein